MSEPILRNHVAEKLARDEVVLSMTVRLIEDIGVSMIAKSAGFDSIFVDLEHSAFSLATASQICVAAQLAGITPFVRVPALEPEFISRILDAGAMGIIAPHIDSADDARRVVGYAKYPPLGRRSASGRLPQNYYRRMPVAQAYPLVNGATTVLAMIETRGGLENVEEIAAVDGVDILHVGAADLSNELGVAGEVGHPLVEAAIMRAVAAARKRGKHVGIGGLIASQPALAARLVAAGVRYVSVTTDLELLCQAAAERVKAVMGILAPARP